MRRARPLLALVVAVVATWALTTLTAAQSTIPNGVFVKNSQGFIWLVVDGQRIKIPVWPASDADVAALPEVDRWAVANETGAVVAGDRPSWLDNQPAPVAAPAPPAPTPGLTISGEGKQNTRPFDLSAGSYTVRWTGTMRTQFSGNLIMTLKRTDGQFFQELLVNTVLTRDAPTASGETQVYKVKDGAHYLEVLAPGPWSATFTPL